MSQNDDQHFHENKQFKNVTYEDKHLVGRVFKNCTFYKCSMKGCFFEDSNFDRCTFDECDISLMKFKDTGFSGVTIKNSKAIGVLWVDTDSPFSAQFLDSRISFSSFFGKNLKKINILRCQADEADFSNCNLMQADFSGTDLRNAIFSNSDLSKANFVGATNYYIDAKNNKIAKAKFSLPEALSFLYAMDIELVEDEEG